MEVINWKENKEVGTICFEVKFPMKKPKIFLEFFNVSFRKKLFIFGIDNFILEENKNIYGNAFIPSKSHWNIGLLVTSRRLKRLNFFGLFKIHELADSFCDLKENDKECAW